MGVRQVSYVRVDLGLEHTKSVSVAGLIRALRYAPQFEGKTAAPNYAVLNSNLSWLDFVTQQSEALAAEVVVGIYTYNPIDDLANRNGRIKADVGADIEVKHTFKVDGHLIITDDSRDSDVAVLVVGRNPTYYLMGWMPVIMAKKDRYRTNRPGYWVPQSSLFEMKTLGKSVYGSVQV